MIKIAQVDPADEALLRTFWETGQAAIRADRPDAVLHTWGALRYSVRHPSPYFRRVLLVASCSDRPVGVAQVGLSDRDNLHLADAEISVLPPYRRQGVGRQLYDELESRCRAEGRTTVIGEVYGTGSESAPVEFARRLGFARVHTERHLAMSLPLADDHLVALRSAAGADSEYQIVTWRDRCPDEHVAAYCRMLSQMESDVPLGEIDYRPVVWDEARLRVEEEQSAGAYHRVTAAACRSDGAFGGYSYVFMAHDDDLVVQEDTLVMPEHRGQRLGLRLKLATLEVVQAEHPERVAIHTWTDPENHPMMRTNTAFGFEPVETMHEMQKKLDG